MDNIGLPPQSWATLDGTWKNLFIKRKALTLIRMQPFFGVDSSLPTTVKIRRPVRHIDIGEISDHTAKHSPPFKVEPIYTMDDICWKHKKPYKTYPVIGGESG